MSDAITQQEHMFTCEESVYLHTLLIKAESTSNLMGWNGELEHCASYLVMFAYISMALGDTPCLSSFYISSKVWFYFCF